MAKRSEATERRILKASLLRDAKLKREYAERIVPYSRIHDCLPCEFDSLIFSHDAEHEKRSALNDAEALERRASLL